MNVFLWASAAMLAMLAPCGYIVLRGGIADRLLGLELGSALTTLALLCLAEGFHRTIYFDLALVYGVASFVAALAVARFIEGSV
jgi:multisubunit Na+/H+ antiporter MnhF subunit